MRTASGKYRIDAGSSDFFRTTTIRIISRGQSIIGRFGRTGTLRGSFTESVADIVWHDASREGWMECIFAADCKSGTCEYGLRDGPSLGRLTLTKISRSRAAHTRHPVSSEVQP